jgi:hypothetical protein
VTRLLWLSSCRHTAFLAAVTHATRQLSREKKGEDAREVAGADEPWRGKPGRFRGRVVKQVVFRIGASSAEAQRQSSRPVGTMGAVEERGWFFLEGSGRQRLQ